MAEGTDWTENERKKDRETQKKRKWPFVLTLREEANQEKHVISPIPAGRIETATLPICHGRLVNERLVVFFAVNVSKSAHSIRLRLDDRPEHLQ